jgi:hypothetical protein
MWSHRCNAPTSVVQRCKRKWWTARSHGGTPMQRLSVLPSRSSSWTDDRAAQEQQRTPQPALRGVARVQHRSKSSAAACVSMRKLETKQVLGGGFER